MFYVDSDICQHGLIEMETPISNKVKTYDIKRCICDIIRTKNRIGIEHIKYSVGEYTKRKDEDLIKLSLYVKKMRDKRSCDGLMWV